MWMWVWVWVWIWVPKEAELLADIGLDLGLTPEQIEAIKANPKDYAMNPPANRVERFEQMVNLIQMVQANGQVKDEEMKLLERIAVGIGYSDLDEVDVESIVALIVRGEDVEIIIEELL